MSSATHVGSEDWTIDGGRARLAARLDVPTTGVRGYALFAHCFTCGKDVRAAQEIARSLAAAGIGVLRVDFTGLGHSDGDTADTSFSGDVDDLVRAAEQLAASGRGPQLLVGHSLGGAAVLAAAGRIPGVRAVATIGAPMAPVDVTGVLGDAGESVRAEGAGPVDVDLGGVRPFRLHRDFLVDLALQPQRERLAALPVPLLVLHAPDDAIVAVDQARQIAAAAGHGGSLVLLDGADHLLSRAADARWAAGMIGSWFARVLPHEVDGDSSSPAADPSAADRAVPGSVVVSATDARPYGQRIDAGGHHWVADEPESSGGADSGPDPYQLLLSALGACSAITLRLYAARAGLPLDDVTVTLTHDRLHADDCAACETERGQVDRIVREIRLEGDLDEAQRARLLAIADKCPVHKTLQSETVIETDLV